MKRFLFTWCGGLGLAASLAASEVPRIMQLAIIREDLALHEQCLASGLPVDGVDDSDPPQNKEEVQPNSLMLAIAWKKPEAVQWLLDRGAKRLTDALEDVPEARAQLLETSEWHQ